MRLAIKDVVTVHPRVTHSQASYLPARSTRWNLDTFRTAPSAASLALSTDTVEDCRTVNVKMAWERLDCAFILVPGVCGSGV